MQSQATKNVCDAEAQAVAAKRFEEALKVGQAKRRQYWTRAEPSRQRTRYVNYASQQAKIGLDAVAKRSTARAWFWRS